MDTELLYSREEPSTEQGMSYTHCHTDERFAKMSVEDHHISPRTDRYHIIDHQLQELIKPVLVSLSMYRYLCECIVGTEETVKTKRLFNAIKDKLHYDDKLANITVGSFGEGLELRNSDRDIVVVYKRVRVYNNIHALPSPFQGSSFCIDVNDTRPGYARLCLIATCDEEQKQYCIKEGTKYYLSNELIKELYKFACSVQDVTTPHGPSLSDKEGAYDFVFSLHCSEWISICNEWETRSKTTWPSLEVKLAIFKHGVLFVPVGSKTSYYTKLEWRISFAVCEKLLVYSFNHTQLLAYALVKILLKDVIKKTAGCGNLLSSYYIKNIVFWLCEELDPKVWRPDNLIQCFLTILKRIIYCVKYSVCPHYFIPDNNMFEETFQDKEINLLLERLTCLQEKGWRCILLSDQFDNFQISVCDLSFRSNETVNLQKHLLCSGLLEIDGIEFGVSTIHQLYKRAVGTAISQLSTKIKSICTYFLSRFACYIGQWLSEVDSNNNKETYKNQRMRQAYLLQNGYQDAASGWLMLATCLHYHKQCMQAIKVLDYAMSTCSSEKEYYQRRLNQRQLKIVRLSSLAKPTITRMIKLHVLKTIEFLDKSILIPKELGKDVQLRKYFAPPLAFGQFLAALCYSTLHDEQSCKRTIKDLIKTVKQKRFIGTPDKENALHCLKIVFQVAGYNENQIVELLADSTK